MKKIFFIFFVFQLKVVIAQSDSLLLNDSLNSNDSIEIADTIKTFKLSIYSNFDSSKIYIDTSFVGITPLTDYDIKKGSYILKLINPNSTADWKNENELRELILSNDTTLNINFNYFYYFNSDPLNTNLIRDDTLFGITPVRIFSEMKLTGNFLFRKNNYMDFVFDMNNYNFGTGADVKLQPLYNSGNNNVVFKNRNTQFNTKRNLPAILLLGAASVAGASLAINYKNTANDAYSVYRVSGNTLNLDESNNNDIKFAISLVLMQLAIGGLIYFLFFD